MIGVGSPETGGINFMPEQPLKKPEKYTAPTFLQETSQDLPLPIFVTKTSLKELLDTKFLDTSDSTPSQPTIR